MSSEFHDGEISTSDSFLKLVITDSLQTIYQIVIFRRLIRFRPSLSHFALHIITEATDFSARVHKLEHMKNQV
jgi:hypothetical protein